MALTRRQKQVLDFVREFIAVKGYSPSLEEIGRHFSLSSVATVHKHVTNLVRKGLLRRARNQNRSIEVVADGEAPRAVEIPLLGRVPAGRPGEPAAPPDTLSVPLWLVGRGRTYALRVAGDSMAAEKINDGDFVIIEERRSAENGQIVVAIVHGENATLRTFRQDGELVHLGASAHHDSTTRVPADRLEVRGVVRGVIRKC